MRRFTSVPGAQVPATALPLPVPHPPGATQLSQLREAYGGLTLFSKPHGKMGFGGTGSREEGVTKVEPKCPIWALSAFRVASPAEPGSL